MWYATSTLSYGKDEILAKIKEIKEVFGEINCYMIALILCSNFDGEVYYDGNHVVFVYGTIAYDQTGILYTDIDELYRKNYMPIAEYGTEIEKALFDAI